MWHWSDTESSQLLELRQKPFPWRFQASTEKNHTSKVGKMRFEVAFLAFLCFFRLKNEIFIADENSQGFPPFVCAYLWRRRTKYFLNFFFFLLLDFFESQKTLEKPILVMWNWNHTLSNQEFSAQEKKTVDKRMTFEKATIISVCVGAAALKI